MTDRVSGAVFVSYAREDSDAARRIAEALRSHGLEVWFDQDELRGGEAWDQKLRRQIKECALFVPVVSANTQERREGYFRLEWKLASERTHLMAEGVPFIAPVVIDATKEANALVPAEFMRVQWTRLPGAKMTPEFAEQVKRLLAPAEVARVSRPVSLGNTGQETRATGTVGRALRARQVWIAGGAFAAILLGFFGWKEISRTSASASASEPAARRSAPPTTEIVAPIVNDKSIAVLPFEDRSENKSNGIFTDGVHTDLLTSLTNIRELHVVPGTSVREYRGTTKKVPQIARELGVAFVLDGSVQRSGSSVRITGQLIRAATDQPVWAKNFDKELTAANVFAIQTELAQAIAGELKAVLSPQEQKLIARLPTTSLEAYDLFLKARDLRERLNTTPAIVESIKLLERAVVIDPQFGIAWAKLAWAKAFIYFRSDYEHAVRDRTGPDLLAQGREALARAEQSIAGSSELLLSRGWYYYLGDADFGSALVEFQRAKEMSPNFAEASYAVALVQRRLGRWQDSLASFQAAALIEPANPEYITEIGTLLLAGRRYAEAEVALRRAESLGRTGGGPRALKATLALHSRGEVLPESALVELNGLTRRFFGSIHDELPTKSPAADAALDRAFVLAARGEKDAARTELDDPSKTLRKRLEVGQSNFFGWSDLAMMEALRGNREEALRCARTFSENPRVAKDAWYGANCMATLVYVQAWTGDLAGACDELARLLQTPVYPTGAAINVYSLRLHPAFFPLRGDPRFEALLNDPKNNAPLF